MLNEFVAKFGLQLLIGCGFLALFLFIGSVKYMQKKKHTLGLLFAASELVSAGISVSVWVWALESSGKSTFLFGFRYFAPAAIACICMFAVGAICLILNAYGLAKQKIAYKDVTQAQNTIFTKKVPENGCFFVAQFFEA